MNTHRQPSFRARQQGGLTILMALVLLAVMGAATFSLSRNALREISMAGTLMQGNKAAAGADAGLDWVIIWGQGGVDEASYKLANPTSQELTLLAKIKSTLSTTPGDPVLFTANLDPTMTLNQGGSATTRQDFDLEMRFLGALPASQTGGGSSDNSGAAGGTKVGSTSGDYLWRFVSTGHATPQNAQTYQAKRELIATLPPF
jgi:hypothetical protein